MVACWDGSAFPSASRHGELIYSQQGTRRVAGARSEDGVAIPRGTEVMVARYEKGIAYVKPWVDPADELQ